MKFIMGALLVLAIALLLGAAYKYFEINASLNTMEVVEGKKVGSELRGSSLSSPTTLSDSGVGGLENSGALHPVIEFTTKSGETHTFVSSLASTSMPEGDFEVFYPMGDPESAEIKTVFNVWISAILLGIFGGGCVFIYLILLVVSGKP